MSAYLAKLSVSPFKASGAMWLIRPQNGTGLKINKPSEVVLSTGLTLSAKVLSSGHYSAIQKEPLTTDEDTTETLDIKQKFKESLANVATH